MRLSEAIRLGATMKPQSFGGGPHRNGGSCAIGAATDAIGLPENAACRDYPMPWLRLFDELRRVECPACKTLLGDSMIGPIPHLNDDHRWSRERIADFVELHEPIPSEAHTEELKEELCD